MGEVNLKRDFNGWIETFARSDPVALHTQMGDDENMASSLNDSIKWMVLLHN